MHGISAITGNMHCSLRYFALFERTTSLLASERSERDTYRGNTIENRGCQFIGERAKRARQY